MKIQQLTLSKYKPSSQKLWVGLLFCWMLLGFTSIIHQDQHTLTDDLQCQFCVASPNTTPYIATELLSFQNHTQASFNFNPQQPVFNSFQKITTSNKDPPLS